MRLAVFLSLVLLACGTTPRGRVEVGMTEQEAVDAESMSLVRTWEDPDGWSRYYARFGPNWETLLRVYVRNGYVVSVMR